jgi:hypothetical protein
MDAKSGIYFQSLFPGRATGNATTIVGGPNSGITLFDDFVFERIHVNPGFAAAGEGKTSVRALGPFRNDTSFSLKLHCSGAL